MILDTVLKSIHSHNAAITELCVNVFPPWIRSIFLRSEKRAFREGAQQMLTGMWWSATAEALQAELISFAQQWERLRNAPLQEHDTSRCQRWIRGRLWGSWWKCGVGEQKLFHMYKLQDILLSSPVSEQSAHITSFVWATVISSPYRLLRTFPTLEFTFLT